MPTWPISHTNRCYFNVSKTFCLFQFQGMSVSILGPTFQDLATNVNRNISSLSLIFVGRAFGFLSGSVIGGILYDLMNNFLILGK